MERSAHWNAIYTDKAEGNVSWFEAFPEVSLRMMESAGLTTDTCVVDVGGGDSHVVDELAARGLGCLAVLDVSGAALERARARLGQHASVPTWIEADVTDDWWLKPMDIWHDRAVFHFLANADERVRYRARLGQTLKVGGTAIIATFDADGPERCSGLPVIRYSPETLAEELGSQLRLLEAAHHTHTTPWGGTQAFQYSRFLRTT